jgi:hypothetical protein
MILSATMQAAMAKRAGSFWGMCFLKRSQKES